MGISIQVSAIALAICSASFLASLATTLAVRRGLRNPYTALAILGFASATLFAFTACILLVLSPPPPSGGLGTALLYAAEVLGLSLLCSSPSLAYSLLLKRGLGPLATGPIETVGRAGALAVALSYLGTMVVSIVLALPLPATIALGLCVPIAVGELVDRAVLARMCRWVRVAGRDVCLVDDSRPRACSVGLLAPRIVVTRAALELLDPDELAAIVAHESYHADRRHSLVSLVAALTPLTICIYVAASISVSGFYEPMLAIPVLSLVATVVTRRVLGRVMELRADDYAARVVGADPLARALSKLCGGSESAMGGVERLFYALLSPHPPVEERLRRISRRRGL